MIIYGDYNKKDEWIHDEILARIDEKFNWLKTDILAELKDQIKNELAEVLKEEFRKKKSLNLQCRCFRSMFIIIKIKWMD